MNVKRIYPSDEALIEGIRRNESESYEVLYKMNRQSILSYILNNNGTKDDFIEIQQNTIIIIIEKIKMNNLVLTSSLATYMTSISRNLWYKELRRLGKLTAVGIEEDQEPVLDDAEEQQEKINAVMELFKTLDARCQELLKLRFWGNKKLETIAELVGKKFSATKMKNKRCLDDLYLKYTLIK